MLFFFLQDTPNSPGWALGSPNEVTTARPTSSLHPHQTSILLASDRTLTIIGGPLTSDRWKVTSHTVSRGSRTPRVTYCIAETDEVQADQSESVFGDNFISGRFCIFPLYASIRQALRLLSLQAESLILACVLVPLPTRIPTPPHSSLSPMCRVACTPRTSSLP